MILPKTTGDNWQGEYSALQYTETYKRVNGQKIWTKGYIDRQWTFRIVLGKESGC
ncbi:MAG TPA: hypothetical protein VGC22_06330 [Chitinophaga sp.]